MDGMGVVGRVWLGGVDGKGVDGRGVHGRVWMEGVWLGGVDERVRMEGGGWEDVGRSVDSPH